MPRSSEYKSDKDPYERKRQTVKVGLETVVSYFPDATIKRGDYAYLKDALPEGMEAPAEKRRLVRKDAAEFLAEKAAAKALDKAGLEPADIDLIIAENIGGQYIIPGLAAWIHQSLGFRREIPTWNLQNCCASFVDGCFLASRMLRGDDEYRRVLVVAVTALETGGWGTDKTSFVSATMGDGAGAAIVSREDLQCELLSYVNESCSEVYDWMVMAFDTPENPALLESLDGPVNIATGPRGMGEGFDEWTMTKGRTIISDGVSKALKKAGLTTDDLDLVIVHQAFDALIEIWKDELERIGIPRDKWHDTFSKYGNVGAVDPVATLADLLENGGIPRDTNIALFAPGGGGNTPTMILKWL